MILKLLGRLPAGAQLFAFNTNLMYTNIHTDHDILVITVWLDSLKDRLPHGFPLGAVKEVMVLVTKNNIFEWGDECFLQILGTAMGTSTACMWATIFFDVHETQTLIPTYSSNLLVYKHFIDNIFGI